MLDPFCFLKMYLNERVEIKTKSGEVYAGILEGFDEHINLMLTHSSVEGSHSKVLFLRGENILFVAAPP
ncbi:LSM domain-containing protein [Encephalitozoon hellem]|uniref:D3 CORE snRNP protein n=1 Tax=Encephalitozoon hellem TaxID=27973 RepID=A0A9Q9F9D9_ENCHE|nr:small nuclear ribonucleoprotein [Encephalitozoon hellem ATCC 50504]XP_003888452.1 snRNA-associated SM-like protein [Encephalitozoon hellem ATCC 50504]KAG5859272.1 LSM domain-containing protein [Encephalitozoon hellem]AFM98703.1 small nuclear ribonucleoprotein [Encephalitozoon hellem ATCC 50504]AFM99471.1 snRNA-associated SM-like protein [Encephalitozoon hellem ATCC 50504]UTX43655.1 snRNA SmD3 [Encephalitozoon hellem]UTX44084.1 D3 CORE snRNP smD3 [Encephalitozoon hellem]|eukprot:XP_003887684.1 small nuclear ribonucleoprotein [Encephalitozoon hellem ATCC 50504]